VERPVRRGLAVHFTLTGAGGTIPLPHPEIFTSVAAGETLGCDDDRLRFRVTSTAPDLLVAVSLSDGALRRRKGVNVIEHPVVLEDICGDDLACIHATAHLGRVALAFSFMKDGHEACWIRRYAPGCSVVGKIERRAATEAVDQIAKAVDQLWICRGDLGAQLGQASMARWISAFDPRLQPCPVLMAGQVLEHLTCHESPTRAEVCHLYDLVKRGYSGFVLSDETAIGADPAGAVRSLRDLLTEFQAGN
jgi:pyruvate kinase